MPIYVYDSIQPAIDWIPNYYGPSVESECVQALVDKVANASAVFGESSTVVTAQSIDPMAFISTSLSDYASLTDNIVYKGIVLALFIYYCLLVFHFRDSIATLFKVVKIKNDGSTLLNDATYIFELFLRSTTILWFLACSVTVVKLADIFAGDQIASQLPPWAVVVIIVPVAIAMMLITVYKKIVIHLASNVTLSVSFAHMITHIKTQHTALAVLIGVPSVLLLALYNGAYQHVVMYIIAVEVVAIMGLWLYKSYLLFIEQNVSILHWILYLCAIEIFPFTLLILISLRLA